MTSDNKPANTMTSEEAIQHLGLQFADARYKHEILNAWEVKTKFFRGLPKSDLKGRMLELYNQKNEARDLLLPSAMIISEGWKQCYLRDPTPTEEDPSYHMKRAYGMIPKSTQPQINIVTGLPKVPVVEQPKPTVVQEPEISIVDGKPKQPNVERPKPTIAKKPKRPHRASGQNPLSIKIRAELALFLRTQIIKTTYDTPEIAFYNMLKDAFERYRKKQLCPDNEVGYIKAHWRAVLQEEHGTIFSATRNSYIAGMAFKP
jgi:hypothetical protein